MSGPVLTSKAAAEYCGMAVQTLYNLISRGAGPKHYKQGKRNAFYAADLDAWNQARLVLVPAEEADATDDTSELEVA
jgi:predicted DNA-binding transcriptional regulator AlpA